MAEERGDAAEVTAAKVKRPWWAWGCGDLMTPTDRANLWRFNAWLLAWMAAFVVASLALRRQWVAPGAAAWVVALAPNVLGVVACASYVRFLRRADELLRQIQLEGLALGFGAGMLFMLGYALAERAGAPPLGVGDPLLPMAVCWVLGQWLATRRYQ